MQSPEWEKFKSSYGTETVRVGGLLYTKHRIPLTNYYYGYSAKMDPFSLNFEAIRKSLEENNCINLNFDVPNVLADSEDADEARKVYADADCVLSPKTTFTTYNLLLDLTLSEEDLLKNMHNKQRYNIRYAEKKGVVVKEEKGSEAFDIFCDLAVKTADRQGFYMHPEEYYKKLWEILGPAGIAHILVGYYKDEPLAAWMFFVYDGVLYYPYGGSSAKYRNLQASALVGWRGILLGKSLGCEILDLWGACEDPDDKTDPEWGFTNFKKKFGAEHVKYIPSYDLVLNPVMYETFNFANKARWAFLKLKKKVF